MRKMQASALPLDVRLVPPNAAVPLKRLTASAPTEPSEVIPMPKSSSDPPASTAESMAPLLVTWAT